MKCIILVGGFGTRLRPLTFTVPKSLVPFCNKPIVEHQIAAAVKAGVKHVILAVGWKADDMQGAIEGFKVKYGIEISCSVETSPLGTAGPIRLAEHIIRNGGDPDEPFFVFNSDVICEFPLTEMLALHKERNAEGTICVTRVDDPSKYGVVVSSGSGRIERFVEKPSVFISDKINAGLYILNRSVIDRIDPGVFQMIETDVFPKMAADGGLVSFTLEGYWADIGQPKDFLRGMKLHLASIGARSGRAQFPNVLMDDSVTLGTDSVIGPNVVIGANCVVGKGVRISNACIMSGCRIGDFSHINESVLGWNNRVGRWAKIDNGTITGEDVGIGEEIFMNGAVILPHKTVKQSVVLEGKILM